MHKGCLYIIYCSVLSCVTVIIACQQSFSAFVVYEYNNVSVNDVMIVKTGIR